MGYKETKKVSIAYPSSIAQSFWKKMMNEEKMKKLKNGRGDRKSSDFIERYIATFMVLCEPFKENERQRKTDLPLCHETRDEIASTQSSKANTPMTEKLNYLIVFYTFYLFMDTVKI